MMSAVVSLREEGESEGEMVVVLCDRRIFLSPLTFSSFASSATTLENGSHYKPEDNTTLDSIQGL